MENIKDSEKPKASNYSVLEIKTSSTTLESLVRIRCAYVDFYVVLFQYTIN